MGQYNLKQTKIPGNSLAGNSTGSTSGMEAISIGSGIVLTGSVLSAINNVTASAGAGLTFNTTTNKIDLGGVLDFNDSSNAANNMYFIPSDGANIIRWGADSLGNLPVNSGGAAEYISRFDYVAFHGEHKIYGASGHSGVNIGVYESQTGNTRIKQYKDVAQITIQNTPGINSSMTFAESESPNYWSRTIWQSHNSNTKSVSDVSYSKHALEVYNTNGHKSEVTLTDTWFQSIVRNSDNSKTGQLMVGFYGIALLDGDSMGVQSFPNSILIGKSSTAGGLTIGMGSTDSKYTEGTTNKKGIRLLGYGETNDDTGAGANYTTLVGTSLVPKKYVDDLIPTDSEIKVSYENNADTNAFTDSEKTKLAGLDSSKFLGEYVSLGALQTAHSSPAVGSYANVDSGASSNVERYVWDDSDNIYVRQLGTSTILTDAQVKTQYENNADTNAFTDSEKTAVSTNSAKVTNATHTGEVTGDTALTIANDVVDEANLKVSNSPTNGYVLTAQSGNTGGLTWEASNSIPALTNGQIFIGNSSNEATSFAMSGDTEISSTGVVTIQPDVVTYDKMQDTSAASILGTPSSGGTVEEIPIVEQYLPSGNANIALLNLTTNWDINGNYTGGTAITLTYQGQAHYNADYWFTAVADNTWIRLIRG